MNETPCPVCATLFQPVSRGRNRTPTRTCSIGCGSILREREHPRSRNPDYWGEEKTCPVCAKTFRAEKKVAHCSRSCSTKAMWASGKRGAAADRLSAPKGYIWRKVAFDHPQGVSLGASKTTRYVLEHRVVMEQALGRYLDPRERVHHKNGVRDDNRLENLELWTLDHGEQSPAGVRVADIPHCPTCTCAATVTRPSG